MFYRLKPQSLGQLGKNTVYDKSVIPWKVINLHIVLDVWSDDDLLKTSPSYFVTERLFRDIPDQKFTGIEMGSKLEIEVSETFRNLYSNKTIPEFYLVNIVGTAFRDDFGLENPNKLILSGRVVSFLRKYNLVDAKIEDITKD